MMRGRKQLRPQNEGKTSSLTMAFFAFVIGGILSATLLLNIQVASVRRRTEPIGFMQSLSSSDLKSFALSGTSSGNILQGLRVLVAIAAFDFSQLPHLEEVIDGYHDLCVAGAVVDIEIHATVAYPVTLIDLWNSRITCENFNLSIVLKKKSLRLHLVDCHRKLFYDKINEYDLFIYTEDDIRVTPSVVATYMTETKRLEQMVAGHAKYKPSDFNVGIVRYEYNYPANVVIDDNTRHATMNVTRVYWEHSGFDRPVVPNCVASLGQDVESVKTRYITMKNHHQGMFLATRDLLIAWKDRCEFDEAKNRPGKGNQPTEGTQRVWMSSQMLYGGRHCNVQQVIPRDKFGALTVLHLPNKNYRRVGKYHNRKFADGTEVFEAPSDRLLTAMDLHLGILRGLPPKEPQLPYRGIKMIDDVDLPSERTPLLERRMAEYTEYAKRGGVLSGDDMTKTILVDDT